MPEWVLAVEFGLVRLLIESSGGVATQLHRYIVIKLAVVKKRYLATVLRVSPDLSGRIGTRRLQDVRGREQMYDRQLAGQAHRFHNRAQVFGSADRIGPQWPA